MRFATTRSSYALLAALAIAAALGLGACSRSQSLSGAVTGPVREGTGATDNAGTGLSALSLTPTTVAGGTASAGKVTLAAAAPSGGLVVSLTSSNAVATVPGSVTVPAGATSAGFSVSTRTVTATTSATITAKANGITRTATLSVTAGAVAPPPPVVSTNPCVSMTGLSATVVNATASIPQFRVNRLRAEITGDTPAGTINTTGGCAPTATPAVSYFSGTANLVRRGTTTSVTASGAALTFGPLLFPGALLEPGVVIATDAAGNVLEIVWPALSGLPPGPPILRFQLAQFNAGVKTGDLLDVSMTFNAKAPDGTTATFSAGARGLAVPVLR